MKALSVKQPWPYLIARGVKTIEVRTWTTKHRGDVVIVSGKTRDAAPTWLAEVGYEDEVDAATSSTICLVELVDVRPLVRGDARAACLTSDWKDGRFAWVLANPRPLAQRFVRGQLGLFNIDDKLVEDFNP